MTNNKEIMHFYQYNKLLSAFHGQVVARSISIGVHILYTKNDMLQV